MNILNKNKYMITFLISFIYLCLIFFAQGQENEEQTTFEDIIESSQDSAEVEQEELLELDESEDDFVDEEKMEGIQTLADSGDAEAQFKIGYFFLKGKGKVKSYKKAHEYFTLSGEQGYNFSNFNLGNIYYNGNYGYPKNLYKSFKYYKLAAEGGNGYAQYFIGYMYNLGKGIEKNKLYGYMWLNLASSQNLEEAVKMRNGLDKRLLKKDILISQDMSIECQEKDYKNC